MEQSPNPPDDLDALKATLAVALAQNADDKAMIAAQKLEIAKLKRQIYGPRSERAARLIEQMELELDEAAVAATEDDIAAERAAAKTTTVAAFVRICLAGVLSCRASRRAAAVAAIGCESSARPSPRRWRLFRASGKSSNMCARR